MPECEICYVGEATVGCVNRKCPVTRNNLKLFCKKCSDLHAKHSCFRCDPSNWTRETEPLLHARESTSECDAAISCIVFLIALLYASAAVAVVWAVHIDDKPVVVGLVSVLGAVFMFFVTRACVMGSRAYPRDDLYAYGSTLFI